MGRILFVKVGVLRRLEEINVIRALNIKVSESKNLRCTVFVARM